MASWLKNLIGFEITAPHTEGSRRLEFFGTSNKRLALIIGANGSGKTSIAKALKNLQLAEDGGSSARHQALLIPKSAARAGNAEVHVFDQAYIDENVRFTKADADGAAAKGVKTIVLLGDQGPIAKRIDEIKARIEGMEADKQEPELLLLERTESLKAVKEEMKAVKAELWDKVAAEVEAPRSALSEAFINKILEMEVPESRDDLQAKLDRDRRLYPKIGPNSKEINPPPIPECRMPVDEVEGLLNQVVEKVKLSGREKEIWEVLQKSRIEEIKGVFSNPGTVFCPTCFRDIDAAGRRDVLGTIERILDGGMKAFLKEAEDCRDALQLKGAALSAPEGWRDVDPDEYSKLVAAVAAAKGAAAECRSLLEAKMAAPEKPVSWEPAVEALKQAQESHQTARASLMTTLDRIHAGRGSLDERRKLKAEILRSNDALLRADLVGHDSHYLDLQKAIGELKKQRQDLEGAITQAEDEVNELEKQRADVKVPAKGINAMLSFIFGSGKRLALVPNEDKVYYSVKVRDKDVAPEDLSLGEQNALAIAYFFTAVASDVTKRPAYDKPMLLVIDDPVSSFDAEVKLGMLSFLADRVPEVLKDNDESRVMLLTHDSKTFLALQELLGKLSFENSQSREKKTVKAAGWRLIDGEIKALKDADPVETEYKTLLLHAYDYAAQEEPAENYVIANELRRILEAAVTYHFQTGYSRLDFNAAPFTDRSGEEGFISELKRLRVMSCLNAGSHFEDMVKLEPDWTIESFGYKPEELQRVARLVLCFLDFICPQHVESHFRTDGKTEEDEEGKRKVADIRRWRQDFNDEAKKSLPGEK